MPSNHAGAVTARPRRPTVGTFFPRGFPYVHTLAPAGRDGPDTYAVDEMPAYTNHVGPVAEETGPVGERAAGPHVRGLTTAVLSTEDGAANAGRARASYEPTGLGGGRRRRPRRSRRRLFGAHMRRNRGMLRGSAAHDLTSSGGERHGWA
ncbi:hypothetical protein [Streptomyces phaeochromogenes]